jgi:murein DD-endopeptidase MepM/ murein hydrolase activator NlpD
MPAPSDRAAVVRRARRRARPTPHRYRRLAVLIVLVGGLLGTLLVTAFGQGAPEIVPQTLSSPASRLLPAGPPSSQVVALVGALRIQLPIAQARVSAIGYHATADGALELEPVGRQANEGTLTRLAHKLFGGSRGGLRYYQLGGDDGPQTGALDVGAAAGTDVYSPVDGTVVGITPYVVNGRAHGVRIDIQPSSTPSLVVSLTHLRPDLALSVGSSVSAGTSKLGTLVDFSQVERQALGRYTQDGGNHVELEVHAAAANLP